MRLRCRTGGRIVPMKRHDVFDGAHYAATWPRRVLRALTIGPRYYLRDLPRYLMRRRRLGLPIADWRALIDPLREFRSTPIWKGALPPRYAEALDLLSAAGVRLTLPPVRIEALAALWWSCRDVPGDVIECGAYRGGTSLLLALLGRLHGVTRRGLILDTFEGIAATTTHDVSRTGREYVAGVEQPAEILCQAERLQVADAIEIHRGLFAEMFARWSHEETDAIAAPDGRGHCQAPDPPRRIAFAHIDANLYESTRQATEYVLPRLAPGGAIAFDDYAGVLDLGARLAIDTVLGPLAPRPQPLAGTASFLRAETVSPSCRVTRPSSIG
jgi:O-methyltransferase